MNYEKWVLFNGAMVDQAKDRVSIDIEDRGYNFGDGVYEVIRVYGGQFFTLDEHLDRFFRSAHELRLAVPHSLEELRALLISLVETNQFTADGMVYLQLTRGTAPRNHLFPSVEPTWFAYLKAVPRPIQQLSEGVAALVAPDIRWLRCDIKSLNLLPNVLAKQAASESGCFEAILHRDGTVTEGSASNVYLVKQGTVYTHPATSLILNGITRLRLQALCAEEGIPFSEQPFRLSDLAEADELFLTSTTAEVMPIVQVNGAPVASGRPGVLTVRLQRLLEQGAAIERSVQ